MSIAFNFSDVISDFLPRFCRCSLILMSRFMRFLNKSLITQSPLTKLRPLFLTRFFLNLLDVKATIILPPVLETVLIEKMLVCRFNFTAEIVHSQQVRD